MSASLLAALRKLLPKDTLLTERNELVPFETDGLTAVRQVPWVVALPGLMIFITSIAFNTLSDGIRDSMDIKDV